MPPFVARKRERSSSTQPDTKPPPAKRVTRTPQSNKKKPTLFEAVDAKPSSSRSVEENKKFLAQLDVDQNDEDELSEVSSDEFEDVLPEYVSKRRKANIESDDEDDEEEMTWEDAIPEGNESSLVEPQISGNLELTLDSVPTHTLASVTNADGKKGPSKIERGIRVNTHCLHVQYLMFHNLIRSGWTCDDEVQKTLLRTVMPRIKREVDWWKTACRNLIPAGQVKEEEHTEQDTRGKGKEKASKPSKKHKNQRDWGNNADHAEEGAPNLSRGDPTIKLLKFLSVFWKKRFVVTAPGLRKQGYKELARLEEEVKSFRKDKHNPGQHGERVKDRSEFRKLAGKCEGSRDVGAHLFTALLRGLGLETRLVASLQPVGFGWSKSEEAHPSKKGGVSGPSAEVSDTSESEAGVEETTPSRKPATKAEQKPVKAKTKPKTKSIVKTQGNKEAPIDLSDSESELSSAPPTDDDSVIDVTSSARIGPSKRFDRDLSFPIYWSEVLSPITKTWIPVDANVFPVVGNTPEGLSLFECRGAKADKAKQVFAYVVAFSADGTAKDVTVRYLKRHVWPGKTKGVRIPAEKMPIYNKRGKVLRHEEVDWFAEVMRVYARPSLKRTEADRLEDANELRPVRVVREVKAGSEETLQGYKSSAEFVLERHLRREEALLPHAKQVKTFTTGKGDKLKTEPVYRRKDVVTCKTIESWHKEGRAVKEGEQPLKHVPIRAVTLIRKREIEEAERESGEKMKQALYSRAQTDWIIPPPICNGVIPKNAFGNMDVYVPTMVPKGAVHIRLKGTGRICKKLGIDFAEACTGFEFGNKRAVPVLTGVVVAKENEGMVRDAWRADDAEKKRREKEKREKLALSMWKKMLAGLRIVERVRREYGDDAESRIKDAVHPMAAKRKGKAAAEPTTKKVTGHARKHVNNPSTGTTAENPHQIDSDKDNNNDGAFDDNGGGGFLNDDDNDEDEVLPPSPSEPEAGGFILEDGGFANLHKTSTSKDKSAYPRTPVSLQSLHQQSLAQTPIESETGVDDEIPGSEIDSADNDNDSDEEEEAEETKTTTPPTPPPPKSVRAPSTRRRGRGRATKSTTANTARTTRNPAPKTETKAKAAKTGTRKSAVVPLESSGAGVSEEEDEDEGDTVVETATKRGRGGKRGERGGRAGAKVATGVVRRNASRKSKEFVRSRYFEGAGGGDTDGDVEVDDSGVEDACDDIEMRGL